MKSFVVPVVAFTCEAVTAVSRVRAEVVPTVIIRLPCFFVDAESLLMDLVVLEIFCGYRLECACSYVQCYVCKADAGLF